MKDDVNNTVASFAEAWIEIVPYLWPHLLKYVASFAEAWIEMSLVTRYAMECSVASFAEAWIEIYRRSGEAHLSESPPSRRRGLKSSEPAEEPTDTSRLLRGGVD